MSDTNPPSKPLVMTPGEISQFLADCRTLIAHSRTFYEVRDALSKAVWLIESNMQPVETSTSRDARRYAVISRCVAPKDLYDRLVRDGKSPGEWVDLQREQSIQQKIDELCDAALQRSPEEPSAPQDESGWLIELAMKGVPHWLMVSSVREWTPDAIKAVRFAREEDAEAMLFFLGIEDSKATEHAWVATSPRECGPPADHCEKHGPHRAFAGGCPGCYHEKHDLPRAQEKATAPRTIFEADVAPGGWAYPSTGPSPCQGIAKDGRDCALTMQHEGECSPENGT